MVNLIVAIIISALVGFVAGHFVTAGSDAAPVSLKEAVTGDLDAPPRQFNLPRPPAPKPVKPTAPVMCETGKSLQDQMGQLKFFQLQTICREAERDWQKRNIDEYAPAPDYGSGEADQARRDQMEALRDSVQTSTYWKGEISLTQGDRTVLIVVFASFYNDSNPRHIGQEQKTPVVMDDATKFCTSISPFFEVNGKGMPAGSVSGCGSILRRKGGNFYFSWETFGDELLSPVVSALLFPAPGARAPFEYLNSQTGEWVADSRFAWRPSSHQELTEASERHMKRVEQK